MSGFVIYPAVAASAPPRTTWHAGTEFLNGLLQRGESLWGMLWKYLSTGRVSGTQMKIMIIMGMMVMFNSLVIPIHSVIRLS